MSETDPPEAYRERVYEAFADRSQPFADAVESALTAGVDRLGVETGFLTRIADGMQYVEYAVGDHEAIQTGEQCPLEEAYCRRTLEFESLLSVQDAQASPDVSETAYEAFGLGSYVGSKVVVDDDVYGTVCFADSDTRDRPFSEAEELFVELVARLVGRAIERRESDQRRTDRTARIRADKRRFEGIAENSFDVLFRVDPAGRFTYVSEAVERVLGYEPDDIVGDEFRSHLSDDAVADALDAFDRVLSGEAVQQLELDFRHRDGSVVPVEINATAVTEEGEATAIQGVGRDITERNAREAEIRLRTRAMDAAAVPITMADATEPDNPLVYVNEAFERVTGYTEAEALGTNCRMLQGPQTDSEAVRTLREGIDADRPVTTEILNYRRDGTAFWNRVTVTPIADESGTITHYLGFQEDVTEQRRTTRLVELLNRVLRHNLRNELTVIQGYTDLISDAPDGTDVQDGIRRPLRRLVSLSERARELDTLAKRAHEPVRLGPATLLPTVADRHREEFPAATLDVTVDTDRAVCAGREVETALDQLVRNALVHDPEPDTAVSLSAHDDGDWVVLTVRDDGPGIPPMEVAVVERGHETPLEHGKGLGLWLVNWVVTQYGGSFRLGRDDGTVATLRLPALEADQPVGSVNCRPTALLQ